MMMATATGMTAAAGMTTTGMTATGMTATGMTATGMTATGMTATTAGMSPTPMMPAVAAAPAKAGNEVSAAPVPAGAVPTVVVPAIILTEPDELRALDYIQARGRTANCSGCDHRRRTGAHDRSAGNEDGCGRNGNGESTHDDLSFPLLTKFHNASETTLAFVTLTQINVRRQTFRQNRTSHGTDY
jgi:hypothetical protein